MRDVTLVDVRSELGAEAAALAGQLMLQSAREREGIADFLIEAHKRETLEWKRRALAAELRLENFESRLLAMGELSLSQQECTTCAPPPTHCSTCGRPVRRDTIWGWVGHTWDCMRIGKEANVRRDGVR